MKHLRTASIINIVLLGVAVALLIAGHVRVSISLIALVCLIHTRSFEMLRTVTAALFSRPGSKH